MNFQTIFNNAEAAADRRTKALTALQTEWPAFVSKSADLLGKLGYKALRVDVDSKPFEGCTNCEVDYGIMSYYSFRLHSDGTVTQLEVDLGHLCLDYTNSGETLKAPFPSSVVECVVKIVEQIEKLTEKATVQAEQAEATIETLKNGI